MLKDNLVSIIIPCFNYGHFLPETLDSVLEQTHDNIEIIVINDGSTDNTDEVVNKYLKNYPNKINYYKQENVGIIETRNRGIKFAHGEYLIQLDADDWIDNDYVDKALKLANKEQVDIVYTDAQIFGVAEDFIKVFPDHDINRLMYQNYIHASALTKKSVFSNLKYDKELESLGFEDWDVFLGACLSGKKAKKLKGPLLHYRKHESQSSRTDSITSKKTHEARTYIYKKYLKTHKEQMGNPETFDNLLEKLDSDHRKIMNEVKVLERDVARKIDKINKIDYELSKIKSSRSWKVIYFLKRIKRKILS